MPNFLEVIGKRYSESAVSELRRIVLDKIPSMITAINSDLQIILVSGKFADLFGCTGGEIITKKINKLFPFFYEVIKDDIQWAAKEGFSENEAELVLDGSTLPVYLSWQICRWGCSENTNLGFYIHLQDHTISRQTEFEMANTIRNLEKTNKELSRFAYICSHDINEPLRSISNFLQLINKDEKNSLSEESEGYMQFLMLSLQRLQNLVRDILIFSKITDDNINHTNVCLESLIQEVLDNLSAKILESSAVITHDPLPEIYSDRSQMIQLFTNLIDNGIKFRSPESAPIIHVGVSDIGSAWHFSVKDNGVGVEKPYQEKIFEMFERLNRPYEYEGSGIGLAVCKKIVEFYGGKISMESELGKGSTFYFTLPKGLITKISEG